MEAIFHKACYWWGAEVMIMEKHGKAFSRVYWYFDDPTTVYLNWLSVDKSERHKGLGTKMQELREQIGIDKGATKSCLWVKRDSWMHEWYKRRGYEDWKEYEDDENMIWMIKEICNG